MTAEPDPNEQPLLTIRGLTVFYGPSQSLRDVSMDFQRGKGTAIIGSAGSGKTTLLRAVSGDIFHDPGAHVSGEVTYEGRSFYEHSDINALRREISYVPQLPNLFRLTVLDNLYVPLKFWYPDIGIDEVKDRARAALAATGLWQDHIFDRQSTELSSGQKQQLCLARALIVEPKILLLDEPTANIDHISSSKLEETIHGLYGSMSIVIITHSMQQAARLTKYCGFLHLGQLVEYGETDEIFTNPRLERTKDYITGRYG